MTPTTTSGAVIQRYKIGYHADEWGQRSSTPSGIPDASGSWVRYADHVNALAAGQATAAQAVAEPAKNDTAYAELPEPDIAVGNDGRALIYTSKDIVGEPYYTAGQMRAFADATCAMRASHGQAPAETEFPVSAQADSVPAVSDLPPLPAPDLRDVGTKPQEIKEFLKGYATEYARTAIAARAPADSVQEDAARYRLLRRGQH